jgi:hypothetical protein
MVASNEFLMLSRFEVPPKATRMITNHPDVTATLWVESGAVQLVEGGGGDLHGGPIPLDRGPVTVTNHSSTDNAIVFAAMAHHAPAASVVAAPVSLAPGARDGLFSVICPQDGTLDTDLTPQRADSLARSHNIGTGHSAFVQNQ